MQKYIFSVVALAFCDVNFDPNGKRPTVRKNQGRNSV